MSIDSHTRARSLAAATNAGFHSAAMATDSTDFSLDDFGSSSGGGGGSSLMNSRLQFKTEGMHKIDPTIKPPGPPSDPAPGSIASTTTMAGDGYGQATSMRGMGELITPLHHPSSNLPLLFLFLTSNTCCVTLPCYIQDNHVSHYLSSCLSLITRFRYSLTHLFLFSK